MCIYIINLVAFDEEEDKGEAFKEPKADNEEDKAEPMDDINIELNFIDPNESYFHAIRYYLVNLLDGESYNVGDLADAIVTQVQVGTLIVNEDDTPEDKNVLAFATILPFAIHSKRDAFKSITKYCVGKASQNLSPGASEAFRQILETKKIGLFVNERLMNLPIEPIPSLHKVLKDDWEWAKKEGITGFDVDYILYISKFASELSEEGPARKKKPGEEAKIYYKFEDEEMEKAAEYTIIFNSKIGAQSAGATNPTEYTMKSNLQYQKMILLIPFKKYLEGVDTFTGMLST